MNVAKQQVINRDLLCMRFFLLDGMISEIMWPVGSHFSHECMWISKLRHPTKLCMLTFTHLRKIDFWTNEPRPVDI